MPVNSNFHRVTVHWPSLREAPGKCTYPPPILAFLERLELSSKCIVTHSITTSMPSLRKPLASAVILFQHQPSWENLWQVYFHKLTVKQASDSLRQHKPSLRELPLWQVYFHKLTVKPASDSHRQLTIHTPFEAYISSKILWMFYNFTDSVEKNRLNYIQVKAIKS